MADDPDEDAPAARPSRPQIASRQTSGGRPIRPSTHADPVTAEPVADVEPLPAVVEPPHPASPHAPPGPASLFGGRFGQQVLLPPCVVMSIGFIIAGVAFVQQPPDTAIRTLPSATGWVLCGLGGVSAVCGVALSLSLRRR